MITLVGGTVFLMWLGEQITARGIGNGISLIIFAGIVAGASGRHRRNMLDLGRTGALFWRPTPFSAIIVMADGRDRVHRVHVERAQRRLLVQYPKRQVGNRMYPG